MYNYKEKMNLSNHRRRESTATITKGENSRNLVEISPNRNREKAETLSLKKQSSMEERKEGVVDFYV